MARAYTLFRGPLHALLWEQWRFMRGVLLLPVGVMLVDLGLWVWCRKLMSMPPRQYIDLADTYFLGLVIFCLILLLIQPDRKMGLSFVPLWRHRRLPVRRGTMWLVSVPFRAALGALGMAMALGVHHALYREQTQIPFVPMLVMFVCAYLVLYAVATPAANWGDKAAAPAIAAVAALIGVFFLPLQQSVGEVPLLALAAATSVAIAGGVAQRALFVLAPVSFNVALPGVRAGKRMEVRALPRFRDPLEAQTWHEMRKHGWIMPAAGVVAALGYMGYMVLRDFTGSEGHEVEEFLLIGAPAAFTAAAMTATVAIAIWDAHTFKSGGGRFQFVRPIDAEVFARARGRMHLRAALLALCAIMFLAVFVKVLLETFAPVNSLARGGVSYTFRLDLVQIHAFMRDEILYQVYAFGWIIASLAATVLLLLCFTRINIIVTIAAGAIVLTALPWWNEDGPTAVSWLVVGLAGAVFVLNMGMAQRAGLVRWGAVLTVVLITLAVSTLPSIYIPLNPLYSAPAVIAYGLLVAGALGAVPLAFHLRRSGNWLPPSQDSAVASRRALWLLLQRTALVILVLTPIYGMYRYDLAASTQAAYVTANNMVAALPPDPPRPLLALAYGAIAAGRELPHESDSAVSTAAEKGVDCNSDPVCEAKQETFAVEQVRASIDELESLVDQAAIADGRESFVLTREATYFQNDDRIYHLLFQLLSAARFAAATADSDFAVRCLRMTLLVLDACESRGSPAFDNEYGRKNFVRGVEFVLQSVPLSEAQLRELEDALPKRFNRGRAELLLRRDIERIQRIPMRQFDDELENSLYDHWVARFLGLYEWDQQHALHLVSHQALQLMGESYVAAPVYHLPRTGYLADNGWLLYPHIRWLDNFYAALRLALAAKLHALQHGSFPSGEDWHEQIIWRRDSLNHWGSRGRLPNLTVESTTMATATAAEVEIRVLLHPQLPSPE